MPFTCALAEQFVCSAQYLMRMFTLCFRWLGLVRFGLGGEPITHSGFRDLVFFGLMDLFLLKVVVRP